MTNPSVHFENSERDPLLNTTDSSLLNTQSYRRRTSTAINTASSKQRFLGIRICYFGIFVSSIAFSITVPSLWSFLLVVDRTAEATFLGWLVASFSVGQLIGSPLFGYFATKLNSNKAPLCISTSMIVVANILYAYIQGIHIGFSSKWWLMIARFVMGVGAANSSVMRSYCSQATTVTERMSVMANLSAFQGIGFILGPLIQALFGFLGYPGPIQKPWLYVNIYTAPAFFSIIVAGVNLVLFIVAFGDIQITTSKRGTIQNDRVYDDRERRESTLAIFCCLYLFFITYLVFTNYETIASPLSIDMYSWSKEQSTTYNGYILGGLGGLSVIVLIVTKFMAKRLSERLLMSIGLTISFIGYFTFLPWGTDYPSIQIGTYTPELSVNSSPAVPSTTGSSEEKGCPMDYHWCYSVPRVQLWQFILSAIIITIGFSICNVISFALFSKILQNRPQGTMMGWLNAAGAFARAFGPIVVGFAYKHYGPRIMMIMMLVFVFTGIAVLLFNYKRLYAEETDESDDEDNIAVN